MSEPTKISTEEARSGRKISGMRVVLGVSVIAAIVLMGAALAIAIQ